MKMKKLVERNDSNLFISYKENDNLEGFFNVCGLVHLTDLSRSLSLFALCVRVSSSGVNCFIYSALHKSFRNDNTELNRKKFLAMT